MRFHFFPECLCLVIRKQIKKVVHRFFLPSFSSRFLFFVDFFRVVCKFLEKCKLFLFTLFYIFLLLWNIDKHFLLRLQINRLKRSDCRSVKISFDCHKRTSSSTNLRKVYIVALVFSSNGKGLLLWKVH